MDDIDHRSLENAEPRFDVSVPAGGYRWWYVDGLAESGDQAIVIIAFVGSVFSPYYFAARARGAGNPENHCAVNVGLYRPDGKRWCMTERGAAAVTRDSARFAVGPSHLTWAGDRMIIRIRERAAPFGQRLEGTITVWPEDLNDRAFRLDADGRHEWRPIAPRCRITVDFSYPRLVWKGSAYLDTNAGARALEQDFSGWNWSRRHTGTATSVRYAVIPRTGDPRTLALGFRPGAAPVLETAAEARVLPMTGWRIQRTTHVEGTPGVQRTLEDTPFYARSVLEDRRAPASGPIMHEALSLDRFRTPWVRALLPFRMPRRSGS